MNVRDIILSIKDRYAKKIISGEKLYEFRGWIWKEKVKYVYIYASGDIKKIVARFEVDFIDRGTPSKIWEEYCDDSGVTKREFFNYINIFGYEEVFCIRIENLEILKEENYISLDTIMLKKAPQRFKYLTAKESEILSKVF